MSNTKPIRRAATNPSSREQQAEDKLMLRLRASYDEHLAEATRDRAIVPDFLAALTANESGGDPRARRFEAGVYRRLKEVAAGRLAGYGGVTKSFLDREIAKLQEIAQASAGGPDRSPEAQARKPEADQAQPLTLTSASGPDHAPSAARIADDFIRSLATSWGLTQIMGYHLIGRGEPIDRLLDPAFHYRMAVELLETFVARHHLDPRRDFEALFRCWNTGRPDGQTTDPAYAQKGLRRIELYRQLAAKDRQLAVQKA